jgi:hypothetical protein
VLLIYQKEHEKESFDVDSNYLKRIISSMLTEYRIIEELDQLSTDQKEYVRDILEKMLTEARRDEIYLNAVHEKKWKILLPVQQTPLCDCIN